MPNLPQRHSLASQTADILREGIRLGMWHDRLPGERSLCEKYQISRNTLRAALGQLQRDKLIRAVQGSGNQILGRPQKSTGRLQSRDVGLLSPEPLERLRPTQTLWIDELRALLSERGCRLHVFHGRQYFRANPGPALQRLIADNPHGGWVLTLSNAAVEAWPRLSWHSSGVGRTRGRWLTRPLVPDITKLPAVERAAGNAPSFRCVGHRAQKRLIREGGRRPHEALPATPSCLWV
jgi:hypothetical protein